LVALEGILKAGSPIGLGQLFARYQKGNEESIWTLKDMEAAGDTSKLSPEEQRLLKYSQPAKVKLVGVWDTVGSVGLAAGNIPHVSRSQFDYLQTGLFIPIQNGYHALAVDEHRSDFATTLWTVVTPRTDRDQHRARSQTSNSVGLWVLAPTLGAAIRTISLIWLRCAG
jgi:uncharacterized protein (DUF2235 family)